MTRRAALASLLWLETFVFALRVCGQAVQRWAPQPFLPVFDAFQGSGLPYWLLLSAQAAILIVMITVARRVQTGSLIPNARVAVMLWWAGWIYMAGSIGRIVVGLVVPAAPAWFSTWIPAVFHVVLAAYVLTLAYYYRSGLVHR